MLLYICDGEYKLILNNRFFLINSNLFPPFDWSINWPKTCDVIWTIGFEICYNPNL